MQLTQPSLIITIDTEEGFDWNKPFSRNNHSVKTLYDHDTYMSHIYKKFNIQPIALISYPILNNLSCQELLKKWRDESLYLLGTHLHSWVTPPFEEELSNFNSFAGNLSFELREKKLEVLTEKFIEVLGYQPRYYKCGRYGICDSTYEILEKLNYQYDFSPLQKEIFHIYKGQTFHILTINRIFHLIIQKLKYFLLQQIIQVLRQKILFFRKYIKILFKKI